MKPEPLREKVEIAYVQYDGEDYGRDECIFQENDVKSAVEFYIKYRRAIYGNIQKDYPSIYKLWIEKLEETAEESERYNEIKFSDWFFNYCFGDVIE